MSKCQVRECKLLKIEKKHISLDPPEGYLFSSKVKMKIFATKTELVGRKDQQNSIEKTHECMIIFSI